MDLPAAPTPGDPQGEDAHLILHGENDNDVPIAEAEQLYVALHDVGVPTTLVRYPREGHGLRETAHVVDALERSIAWYTKYFAVP
jgi:dipeptidyl aminopeptidase/acylaminoacyl peptidase